MPEMALPLTIRDLSRDDLPWCAWTGSAESDFATALDPADRGEVDYRTVCTLMRKELGPRPVG
jgi:hypothetical protein